MAIRLDPEDSVTYNNRGITKAALQQHKAAIQNYNEAIRFDSKYSAAYYNRGIAKWNLGRLEEARSDLQTALRLAEEDGNEKLVTATTDALRQIESSERNKQR